MRLDLVASSRLASWAKSASLGRSLTLFVVGGALLVGGIVLLGLAFPGTAPDVDDLVQEPRVLAVIGLALMGLEAVAFTVLPIEIARRVFRRPLAGGLVGCFAYGPLIHWDNGWAGLLTSIWIVTIVSTAYLIERPFSLSRAVCQAVGLKVLFWAFALAALLSDA